MWSFYSNQVFQLLAKIQKKGGLAQYISNSQVSIGVCLCKSASKMLKLISLGGELLFFKYFRQFNKKNNGHWPSLSTCPRLIHVAWSWPRTLLQVLWNSGSLMFNSRLKPLLEWDHHWKKCRESAAINKCYCFSALTGSVLHNMDWLAVPADCFSTLLSNPGRAACQCTN